ncbi:MAG TPA: alpha/beta family hydrolase [Dehalococcoidia bacterium]|nr:alpha/beta family hydrolase [Dehalococcoidia bacterium]
MEQSFKVAVADSESVTVLQTVPEAKPKLLFIYAPGAGSNLHDPFGEYCAKRLPGAGIETWRFQFPYMEAQRRAPDRTPLLEATWLAVIEAAQITGMQTAVGGRSMGGRIASQVAARGASAAALALFAYPLHPPGKPDQKRDAHLGSVTVPTLFCSGTRDTFATPGELRTAASLVPNSTVNLLEGADHGFATLKSSGRTREDVWAEAVDMLLAFLDSLPFN